MLKHFIVTYTSTETLYDTEKQRKQNSMKIKAKDEEDAKKKAEEQLRATGKHNQIVIHSAKLNPHVRPMISKPMMIVMGIIVILLLVSLFQGK